MDIITHNLALLQSIADDADNRASDRIRAISMLLKYADELREEKQKPGSTAQQQKAKAIKPQLPVPLHAAGQGLPAHKVDIRVDGEDTVYSFQVDEDGKPLAVDVHSESAERKLTVRERLRRAELERRQRKQEVKLEKRRQKHERTAQGSALS